MTSIPWVVVLGLMVFLCPLGIHGAGPMVEPMTTTEDLEQAYEATNDIWNQIIRLPGTPIGFVLGELVKRYLDGWQPEDRLPMAALLLRHAAGEFDDDDDDEPDEDEPHALKAAE